MALPRAKREVFVEDLIMKKFLWLIGAALLFAAAGCESDEHYHGGYYGGYYGEYPYRYYGYGHDGYSYPRYYRPHGGDDYWEHEHDRD